MHTQQSVEYDVFRLICKKVNSELSCRALELLNSGDQALLSLKPDPAQYSSAHDFANDMLVCSFLSKWKGHKFNIDTRAVAVAGWTAGEEKCSETNKRLKWFYHSSNIHLESRDINILFDIREKIRSILGPCRISRILELCEWTNGATSNTKFGVPLAEKMSKPLAVTPAALPYLRAVVESDPHWAACFLGSIPSGPCSLLHAYKLRNSNRFLTVPKNAKTDRIIAAEPAGNVFIQKAIGKTIRKRLNVHGISLKYQSFNQKAAQRAFFDGLATLDLKAASDTVSYETVRLLLPDEWFDFLNSCRCRATRVAGVDVNLSKFSSMGNAFTFELESLIFYAISYACCVEIGQPTESVRVYGDDIIIPAAASERVIQVLNHFGFEINIDKSFTSGPYYESCGLHYFEGHDVSPIFQKEETLDLLQERIRLYNRILRWGYRNGGIFSSVVGPAIRHLRKVFQINENEVKNGRIPAIPECVSSDDGYLVDARWIPKYNSNRGYYCSIFVPRVPTRLTRCVDALLAYKLRRKQFNNSDPKGHEKENAVKDITWVEKKTYVQPWPLLIEQSYELSDYVVEKDMVQMWASGLPRQGVIPNRATINCRFR